VDLAITDIIFYVKHVGDDDDDHAVSAVTICQILFPIDKRYDKSKLSR